MNWELLAYLVIVGAILLAVVMAFKGLGGGSRDGGVVHIDEWLRRGEHPKGPRSWHGNLYVDDNTGRVIGRVVDLDGLWQAVGDHTAVYIDEASARRAIEIGYATKEALR